MPAHKTPRRLLMVCLTLGLAIAGRGPVAAFGNGKNTIAFETIELASEGFKLSDDEQAAGMSIVHAPSGEAVLVERVAGQPAPERTPLGVLLLPYVEQGNFAGYTPPIGSNKGSIVASVGASGWAAVPTPAGISVFDLGDLQAPGPLVPHLLGTLSAADAFRPGVVPVGIIAILIGLSAPPVPTLVLREADGSLSLFAFTGSAAPAALQPSVAPTLRLTEEEGTYWLVASRVAMDKYDATAKNLIGTPR
jgi:hypothetical protein